jgi:surfeit locus 1 family protein
MAAASTKAWGDVAPFYVAQEAPVPPGGWPKPGPIKVSLPDNHLGYAITWFGLALALVGVYIAFVVGRWRRPPENAAVQQAN